MVKLGPGSPGHSRNGKLYPTTREYVGRGRANRHSVGHLLCPSPPSYGHSARYPPPSGNEDIHQDNEDSTCILPANYSNKGDAPRQRRDALSSHQLKSLFKTTHKFEPAPMTGDTSCTFPDAHTLFNFWHVHDVEETRVLLPVFADHDTAALTEAAKHGKRRGAKRAAKFLVNPALYDAVAARKQKAKEEGDGEANVKSAPDSPRQGAETLVARPGTCSDVLRANATPSAAAPYAVPVPPVEPRVEVASSAIRHMSPRRPVSSARLYTSSQNVQPRVQRESLMLSRISVQNKVHMPFLNSEYMHKKQGSHSKPSTPATGERFSDGEARVPNGPAKPHLTRAAASASALANALSDVSKLISNTRGSTPRNLGEITSDLANTTAVNTQRQVRGAATSDHLRRFPYRPPYDPRGVTSKGGLSKGSGGLTMVTPSMTTIVTRRPKAEAISIGAAVALSARQSAYLEPSGRGSYAMPRPFVTSRINFARGMVPAPRQQYRNGA